MPPLLLPLLSRLLSPRTLLVLLLFLPLCTSREEATCLTETYSPHDAATLPYLRFKWPSSGPPTISPTVELELLNLSHNLLLSQATQICFTIDYAFTPHVANFTPPPLPPCVPLTLANTVPAQSTYFPTALTFTHNLLPRLPSHAPETVLTVTAALTIHNHPAGPTATVTFPYKPVTATTIDTVETIHHPGHPLTTKLQQAFQQANDPDIQPLSPALLSLPGMSGVVFRKFLSLLLSSLPSPNYLEVGVWSGSSFVAAIAGNEVGRAVAVDDWSQFGGPVEAFRENVGTFGGGTKVDMIERDCWDPATFGELEEVGVLFDVYFFDGPHEVQDHFRSVVEYFGFLARDVVFIVDDWNFGDVRVGTYKALEMLPVDVVYERIVFTNKNVAEDETEWHNGMAAFVLRKHEE